MKLKLPLALLAALCICMNVARAEDASSNDETTESSMTVNEWGMRETSSTWGVNGDVTWTADPGMAGKSSSMNIGDYLGDAVLTIKPEADGGEVTVNMVGSVFLGGSGYYTDPNSAGEPNDASMLPEGFDWSARLYPENNHSGTLNIEKGATLGVGTGVSDPTGAHMNIAWGRYCTATVNVNGGRLTSDCSIYVGDGTGATGYLKLKDGGSVEVDGSRMPQRSNPASQFYVGVAAGSRGYVTLEDASSLVLNGTDNGYCWFVMGLTAGGTDSVLGSELANSYGDMTLTGKSTATFTDTINRVGDSGDAVIRVQDGSSLTFASNGNSYWGSGQDVDLGRVAGASGRIEVSGQHEDGTVSSLSIGGTAYIGKSGTGELLVSEGAQATIGGIANVGYNGGKGTLVVSEGAQATVGSYMMVGGWYGAQGTLEVTSGGSVEVNSALYLGYGANTSGSALMDGADSSLTTVGSTYVGFSGSASLTVQNGADVTLGDFLCIGYGEGASGTVTVDGSGSSLGALGDLCVGYSGTGELAVTGGASMTVMGDAMVAEGSSLTVTQSDLTVSGTMTNYGTVTMDLTEGGSFQVANYSNYGTSTIRVAEDTSCQFGGLTLAEGTMTLEGGGEFTLGGGADESSGELSATIFTVSGAEETTNIDVSALGEANFTIAESAVFTLDFTSYVAEMEAGASESFTLRLIIGSSGFSMEEDALIALLGRTNYNFESDVAAVAFALALNEAEEAGIELAYRVENAAYTIQENADGGNDLVWTGTVVAYDTNAVPEPATATLSLLALAGLAARRRRC